MSRNGELGDNSEQMVFVAHSQHVFNAFCPKHKVESRSQCPVIVLLSVFTELPRGFALHWKTAL